ncbi:hypothetical protein [Persephonella sp.]
MISIYRFFILYFLSFFFISFAKSIELKENTFIGIKDQLKEINKNEILELKNLVDKVHKSIKYGIGKNDLVFRDEILEYGEGHCGHLVRILLTELLKKGYSNFDIVYISTYNKRIHTVMQIKLKKSPQIVTLDPTTNLVYPYSVEEILKNPFLSKNVIGTSKYPVYSDLNFWSTVRQVLFIPYYDAFPIKPEKVYTKHINSFFPPPHNIDALFDGNFSTYTATKTGSNTHISISAKLKKESRISSIVIYPYDEKNYPEKIKIMCKRISSSKIIFDSRIFLKRGIIVINLPEGPYCDNLEFNFSKFKGQNRLLIRDIYIYGK